MALTSLLSIGPVVACLALPPVYTGGSALIAIFLSIPLGAGDFRFLSTQHFLDTGVVLVIGCLAVYVSHLRVRTTRLLALSEQRATRDVLTNALNRRAVFETGNRLAGWRHDIRPPLTLMMIDVDHLKEVNDTYGHQTGDHVIAEVSKRLATALREGDIVGRYGGDEFLAVLIGGNRVDTSSIAERTLGLMLEPVTYLEGHDLGVSVSIGISELGPDETEMQPALGRADNALYISKRCGRNRFTRDDPSAL